MEEVCARPLCSGQSAVMRPRRDASPSIDDAVARAWTSIAASATLLEQLQLNLAKSQAAVDASRREVRRSFELIQRLSTPGPYCNVATHPSTDRLF